MFLCVTVSLLIKVCGGSDYPELLVLFQIVTNAVKIERLIRYSWGPKE